LDVALTFEPASQLFGKVSEFQGNFEAAPGRVRRVVGLRRSIARGFPARIRRIDYSVLATLAVPRVPLRPCATRHKGDTHRCKLPPIDVTLRLLVAAGLGGAIGLEREFHHKPAGLRTQTLIAVGAALFTMASIELAGDGGTVDRVAAQIVTGVGFLGGG